jgi:hypothetical protein
MPTTRRRRTRGRITTALSPALVDFLLDGKTRSPDDVPPDELDGYDFFVEFDPWTPAAIEALWLAHGPALEAERRRRALASGRRDD